MIEAYRFSMPMLRLMNLWVSLWLLLHVQYVPVSNLFCACTIADRAQRSSSAFCVMDVKNCPLHPSQDVRSAPGIPGTDVAPAHIGCTIRYESQGYEIGVSMQRMGCYLKVQWLGQYIQWKALYLILSLSTHWLSAHV